MGRRKKSQLSKQLLVVGSILIAFQIAYIFLVPRPKAVTSKDAIQAQLDRQSLDPKRKEQLRIQLSLDDYKTQQGQLPSSLSSLIPKYFDKVPNIPETGKPFQYIVKDGRAYVGDEALIAKVSGKALPQNDQNKGFFLGTEFEGTLPPEVQQALINSLKDDSILQPVAYVYDPTGKRDPFKPFDFTPKQEYDETRTPLEQYEISQLKLTAVLGSGDGDTSATVENAAGRGFIVKKGTKIGSNRGEIVDIKPDALIIVETATDFTGQKKTRTVEMKLRTKDQEAAKTISRNNR